MSELPDFLLARIAEDEAVAQAVTNPADMPVVALQPLSYSVADGPRRAVAVTVHPARVLAESSSKRRIVAWHRLIDGLDRDDKPVRGCGNCIASGAEPPYIIAGPCMTLRLLALPYADHPDYDQTWRP